MNKEQLLNHCEKLDKLEHALSTLASLDTTIHDATLLDELTDPLLTLAGGLANHCVAKLSIDPIYNAPNLSVRSMVANEITTTTNKAYDQLLPIRNRAVSSLSVRFEGEIKSLQQRLDVYTGRVFSRVRDALAYGVTSAGLSGTRVVTDDQMRKLLGYAIKNSGHEKVTEMILWQVGQLAGGLEKVLKDSATFEYVEANVRRFNQGSGFAPVARQTPPDDNPQMKHIVTGFSGEHIIGYFKEGLTGLKFGDYDSNNPEEVILEQPTMQDVYSTLESLNTTIRRMVENIFESPLFPDEYVNEEIRDAVVKHPLHVKQYNTYYGDSSTTPEEVEVMINRIAAIKLGQLSYVFYVLDNILTALPVLMNYFIRDKIKS